MDWKAQAVADIAGIKPHWAGKYDWRPCHIEADGYVDLFVHMRGRRLPDKHLALRLRYLPDWTAAGRREAFVDPEDFSRTGAEFWPPENAVRGVNPTYRPNGASDPIPCICLRGVWGYHSMLHANEPAAGTKLMTFLLELQRLMDE
jgi:hypothetical protein